MKKLYILLFVLIVASGSLFAQSLQLFDHLGNAIPNGGTVIVDWRNLYDTTSDVFTELKIKNNSTSAVTLKAIKTAKILPGAQKSYYCFAGFCFGDTTTVSPNELDLAAGQTDNNFSAHINPWNTPGNSVVYYKVYNTRNANDTVSVFIQTRIWHAGINDNDARADLGAAYPNPANEKFTVDYSLSGAGSATLVLQNVLGSKVREVSVTDGSGKIQVNVAGLPEGVYLYSIYVDGKAVSTRKVLVRH